MGSKAHQFLPCMTRMQTCLMCWSLGSLPWKEKWWLNRFHDSVNTTLLLSSENSTSPVLLTCFHNNWKIPLSSFGCSWVSKTCLKNSKCTVVKLKMSLPFSSPGKLTFWRCKGFPLRQQGHWSSVGILPISIRKMLFLLPSSAGMSIPDSLKTEVGANILNSHWNNIFRASCCWGEKYNTVC